MPAVVGADRPDAEAFGGGHRLGVEVVDDLHVVGDEADGHEHHLGHAVAGQLLEVVVDVGLEPRRRRRPRARAVDEVVPVAAAGGLLHPGRDLVGGAAVLADVRRARLAGRVLRAAALAHRARDGVRDEDQPRTVAAVGQLGEGGDAPRRRGLDEAGVVVVLPQLVEPGRAGHLLDGVVEVLAVLPARRPRGVRRRGEDGGPGDPVGRHRGERVGEVGVPVAVAEVDRQVEPLLGQVLLQRGDERPVLVVDRAASAEEEVVLADLLEPLTRDAPPAGDVLEERHDVLGLLRAPEGEHEESVVGSGVGSSESGRGCPRDS